MRAASHRRDQRLPLRPQRVAGRGRRLEAVLPEVAQRLVLLDQVGGAGQRIVVVVERALGVRITPQRLARERPRIPFVLQVPRRGPHRGEVGIRAEVDDRCAGERQRGRGGDAEHGAATMER